MARRRSRWTPPKIARDSILFAAGLGGFIHEVLIWDGNERPFILAACLGMMGAPAFLGWDERKPPTPPKEPAP